MKIEKRLLDEAVNAWNENGHNKAKAARALGIPRTTLISRLEQASRPQKEEQAEKKEPTLEDNTTLHRAQEAARLARAKAKDALREVTRLQDRMAEMEHAAKSSAKPASWTYRPDKSTGKKSEHMPYLFTSDFQLGEVIRPEETDHAHGYNTEIFRQRYKRLIETTIYLSMNHRGDTWEYPGIIYARGGDTISGAIHDELKETDDLTPIEAVEIAFEEEAAGIRELASAFGRVDVKDAGGGNHDRDTRKPQSKKANAHSYDRLVSFMLRNEFKDDGRVTFQTTQSPDVYFPIYDQNILLTHGDKIGSRGGQGLVGPMATIMRGAQKTILEQAALGRRVDRLDVGHFHTPAYLEWVLANGCLPGYSEFAKQNRMRPSKPQQWLLFHHPKRGVVDARAIYLA